MIHMSWKKKKKKREKFSLFAAEKESSKRSLRLSIYKYFFSSSLWLHFMVEWNLWSGWDVDVYDDDVYSQKEAEWEDKQIVLMNCRVRGWLKEEYLHASTSIKLKN